MLALRLFSLDIKSSRSVKVVFMLFKDGQQLPELYGLRFIIHFIN